jgi:MFS family permease
VIIKAELRRLRRTEWWEYAVRFAFGGIVTVATGLVAKELGPIVGGLFLAFPGIFPAGVTLVERHERRKKEKKGLRGERRARLVSGVVSAGAVLGSIGLVAFAALGAWLFGLIASWQVIALATALWLGVSVLAWWLRLRVLS